MTCSNSTLEGFVLRVFGVLVDDVSSVATTMTLYKEEEMLFCSPKDRLLESHN